MICQYLLNLGIKARVNYCNLNAELLGFVYYSKKHRYYIILNQNVTCQCQIETFFHEVAHIIQKEPAGNYIFNMDMQYSIIEKEADMFAENILNYVNKNNVEY